MPDVTIEPVRDGDLALILRDFGRFWSAVSDDTLLRHLHHPVFFREFADTAFAARTADGQIAGYLRRPLGGVSITET